MPLAQVAHVLRTTFGVQGTRGGLAHVAHGAARATARGYTEPCEQARNASMVSRDEIGWRGGGEGHWLWVFATRDATVYPICRGRRFDDAATVASTGSGAPDMTGDDDRRQGGRRV